MATHWCWRPRSLHISRQCSLNIVWQRSASTLLSAHRISRSAINESRGRSDLGLEVGEAVAQGLVIGDQRGDPLRQRCVLGPQRGHGRFELGHRVAVAHEGTV
jgi:hypothetical protein